MASPETVKLLACGCYQMDRKITRQAIRDYLKRDPNHNWREMKHNVAACMRSKAIPTMERGDGLTSG